MNTKYIYLAVIVLGVGAISYMYYLSDVGKTTATDTTATPPTK